MHINFYFKVTLLGNRTFFLPRRSQGMFRIMVQGMGEISRKPGYKSDFAVQMSSDRTGGF